MVSCNSNYRWFGERRSCHCSEETRWGALSCNAVTGFSKLIERNISRASPCSSHPRRRIFVIFKFGCTHTIPYVSKSEDNLPPSTLLDRLSLSFLAACSRLGDLWPPESFLSPLFHVPVGVLRLQLYTSAPGSLWVLEFLRLTWWLQGCDLFPSLTGRTASELQRLLLQCWG